MDTKMNLEDLVIYDFSNIDLQENSNRNCFESSRCNCDSCDMCDSCDHGW